MAKIEGRNIGKTSTAGIESAQNLDALAEMLKYKQDLENLDITGEEVKALLSQLQGTTGVLQQLSSLDEDAAVPSDIQAWCQAQNPAITIPYKTLEDGTTVIDKSALTNEIRELNDTLSNLSREAMSRLQIAKDNTST